MLSKRAASNSYVQDSSYLIGFQEYENNPYHPTHNPSGVIQMALAENHLSFDLIESWLERNQDVNEFRMKNGESMLKELALFQDYHGLQAFKNELGAFMSKMRGSNKVKFDPKKIVLTAGATAANETLIFCLAEPGEAFLIPTPYYPGFDRDLKWRTEVEIVPIHCNSSNNFKITEPAMEEAYQEAEQKLGLKVKGVVITNPSNPLGTTLTRPELDQLISFAISKNIHIVSNEIYAGTVFSTTPGFTSILTAASDKTHKNRDVLPRVHVVSSLSKDFGLQGFRIGMIYSDNDAVISAATKMSSFGLVSSQSQYLLSNILGDRKFTKHYVRENKKRIKERREKVVSGLSKSGIPCLDGDAGLFCWVDMRGLLKSNTFESEMELWKRVVCEAGLNISPGSSYHCGEPGWFRVCFANMSEETVEVAVRRMKVFVESVGGGNRCRDVCRSPPPAAGSWWRKILLSIVNWCFK